jgi:hypothetical protein
MMLYSAYSDASSTIGVGVVIGRSWNAWLLKPGWNSDHRAPRDIQWAEAVGLELAIRYVFERIAPGKHSDVRFWCDNSGVTEGWWKQRSRNRAVNDVFKRIGTFLEKHEARAHTRYIESARNPADGPSRFDFSGLSAADRLPALALDSELNGLLVDTREPGCADDMAHIKPSARPAGCSDDELKRRRDATAAAAKFHSDLLGNPTFWWDDPEL